MKRILGSAAIFLMSISAFADGKRCYQLSKFERIFSRSPDQICFENDNGQTATMTYWKGGRIPPELIGTYDATLVLRLRCFDCNGDQWSINNGVFNVRFGGKMDLVKRQESGRVEINGKNYFYRRPF